MSDLGTSWISPFWQTWTFGADDDWQQSTVYVANPGPKPASLTIRWIEGSGGRVDESPGTPPAGSFWGWSSPLGAHRGWLLVTSDQPVAPWGITPGLLTPEPVNMSFYRVDDSVVRFVVGRERA